MEYFSRRFPDVGPLETRCFILGPGGSGLEPGKYALLERYCEELPCDCRKVLIEVVLESEPGRVLATISYGWEKPSFYEQRFSSVANAGWEIAGGALDRLGAQSEYAETLLEFFQDVLIKDAEYVKRLERHYWMFKRSLRPEIPKPGKKHKW